MSQQKVRESISRPCERKKKRGEIIEGMLSRKGRLRIVAELEMTWLFNHV